MVGLTKYSFIKKEEIEGKHKRKWLLNCYVLQTGFWSVLPSFKETNRMLMGRILQSSRVQRWKHSTVLTGGYFKRRAGQVKGPKTKGKTLYYYLFLSCPTWTISLHQGIWWSLGLTQYTAYKTPKKQLPSYSVVFFTGAMHKKFQSCGASKGSLKTSSIINRLAMNNNF